MLQLQVSTVLSSLEETCRTGTWSIQLRAACLYPPAPSCESTQMNHWNNTQTLQQYEKFSTVKSITLRRCSVKYCLPTTLFHVREDIKHILAWSMRETEEQSHWSAACQPPPWPGQSSHCQRGQRPLEPLPSGPAPAGNQLHTAWSMQPLLDPCHWRQNNVNLP